MALGSAPPSAMAVNTDNSKMTNTSSTTAAPRSANPSRLRSLPSSSKVCALMLTLVAVRMMPTKSAACPR